MRNINIQKALVLAENSDHRCKIGCIITNRRGKIISQGFNRLKTHPMQFEYAKRYGIEEKIYLHAEMAALIKCREQPYSMYIGRVMHNTSIGMCKPCPICQMAIKEAGVKYVMYTDESGDEVTVEV